MRELKAGQKCEHESTALVGGALTKIGCDTKHHDRAPGEAPKQLVAVKEKKSVRFLCTVHAPMHTKTVRALPRKRGKVDVKFFGEQQDLIGDEK